MRVGVALFFPLGKNYLKSYYSSLKDVHCVKSGHF